MAFVGHRLAIFIPLLIIGILSKIKLKERSIIISLASILVVLLFYNTTLAFNNFNRDAKPIRSILSNVKENKELVELYYRGSFSSYVYYDAFLHFACYYQLWKNGLAAFIFSDMNKWHIVERKEDTYRKKVNEWGASKSVFPNGWEDYDYFLVCGYPPPYEYEYYRNLKLIERKGIWALYENPLKNN